MSGPVSGTCLSTGSDVNAELIRWAPASNIPVRSDSRLRLLCFPFAGAGTAIFREWGGQLPEEIQVIPIQLPGRENRWTEPLYRDLHFLTRKLASVLRPLFAKPYALFGHSMGGIICFELTRQLRREKIPLPAHLFISGTRAPHIPDRERPLHGLSDAAFLAGLEGAAGGLDSALSNRD
jgi:surfactin synthase thioesterase subunit